MNKQTLYLCDPHKNPTCRGTVCFYNGLFQHLCYLTPDPERALTDADGLPIALAEDGFASEIRADKMEGEPRRMDHVFEEAGKCRD
jgi:hypothetical protein